MFLEKRDAVLGPGIGLQRRSSVGRGMHELPDTFERSDILYACDPQHREAGGSGDVARAFLVGGA